jgi:hypothetical protein
MITNASLRSPNCHAFWRLPADISLRAQQRIWHLIQNALEYGCVVQPSCDYQRTLNQRDRSPRDRFARVPAAVYQTFGMKTTYRTFGIAMLGFLGSPDSEVNQASQSKIDRQQRQSRSHQHRFAAT